MTKFYVDSGDLQAVVIAANPLDAAVQAVQSSLLSETVTHLGEIVRINERGVLDDHEDDLFYDTKKLLQNMNVDFDT